MELLEEIGDLLQWEGFVPYMYLDTRGFCTIGIGNLVKSLQDALRLPLQCEGRPAAEDEITRAFVAVSAKPPALHASSYKVKPHVYLREADVRALARKRLEKEFLPGLRKQFPEYDSLPSPARRALLDIAYNCGLAGLAKFERLAKAVKARDWTAAAASCSRKTSRPERNAWTRDMFLAAAKPSSKLTP